MKKLGFDEFDHIFCSVLGRRIVDRFSRANSPLSPSETEWLHHGMADRWVWIRERSSSPIELRLAMMLLVMLGSQPEVSFGFGSRPYYVGDETTVVFQPQVVDGHYRIDFVARVTFNARHALIAIECDGHEFHERTKQQAARDRARDRYLVRKGYKVLRFTGSEIYADAGKCVAEIADIIRQTFSELREKAA